MKKNLLRSILLIICFSYTALAQQWIKNLPAGKAKEDLTFYDYQNAFYSYWAPYNVENGWYYVNGVKKKAFGWKHFKRWEYAMLGEIDPATGMFPNKTAQKAYEEYLSSNPAPPTVQSANWSCLGTNSSDGGYSGIGRVSCIAFHPSNPSIYWVGVNAGGLWQTTDNGASWTCLTDNNAVLAVSDIIIPSDFSVSNTIYIATGDRDASDNNSIGVLKSTDGGATWNTTGLTFPISAGDLISRMLVDPNNNQVIIASTTNGVYKTTNGGTTWNTQLTSTYFIDIEYMPGNFNTLYGSTQYGEIYVSTNGGSSWTQAFTDGSAYRIELAVSPNQPSWVYAVAAGSDDGLYGVYKSTDNGASYSQVFSGTTTNMLGYEEDGSGSGGQGWYDLTIAASPSDANNVFIGGVNTWATTDGGNSWTIKNHWTGSQTTPAVHADKHFLKFHSNGTLFECNDGGVYLTTDNGTTWTDKTNGMVISQMYKLGVSATVANETITGLQDNGSKLLSGGTWYDVKGGDGMECLIDYTDVNVQYATYVNGQITRTLDRWQSDYTDIEPSGAGSGAWVTPYIIDPVNNQTLYAGYAEVWKTTDRGNNWTSISSINSSDKIRSMAISASNNQVLYVADLSIIWKTTDGGTNWTDITGTLPVSNGNITAIAVKHNDENTVWVTLGGYNANRVFETIDGGTTWTNISTGLPNIPTYSIVQNKQSTGNVHLYVGTEVGVYLKDGSNNWVAYNTNLPNVRIGELEIYYAANPEDSKLRAATYGRGLWESPTYNDAAPMTYVSSTTTQSNTNTVAPGTTNQQIIGVEIVNTGNISPLTVTAFTFNTTGSTSPVTDITNAKLFYTGSSSTFATGTQYGATSLAPSGSFIISGSQALNGGTNYFWLTYDVPASATMDNFLDAECTSFTMSGIKTPTITSPSGNRQIAISYCGGTASQCDEFVANVTFGTVNNTTTCTAGGYADYTSMSTTIAPGGTENITVTNGNTTYPQDQCGIWVDWNGNGDFTDDAAITVAGSPGVGPYTATLNCPIGTTPGSKRVRVRIHYNDETTAPCGAAAYGEVEDYKIEVLGTPVPPVAGVADSSDILCAGDSLTLTVSGYTGTLQWQQSANGTSGWANVTGGSGSTTSSYTTANLTTTTYYRVEVSQSGFSPVYTNVITITVNPIPTATASASGAVLTAGPSGASYQWVDCDNGNININGATNQAYTATANGSYAVAVTQSGCMDLSSCVSVTTIGIDELQNTAAFSVYPSPASDHITINTGANLLGKMYYITDESGRIVLSGRVSSANVGVRIHELAAGIYLVKIEGQVKKVVKK
jgi:photosystem II stability/assembly factor-like uncharacterized protein